MDFLDVSRDWNVAVIGGGTARRGIATIALPAGLPGTVMDMRADVLENAVIAKRMTGGRPRRDEPLLAGI